MLDLVFVSCLVKNAFVLNLYDHFPRLSKCHWIMSLDIYKYGCHVDNFVVRKACMILTDYSWIRMPVYIINTVRTSSVCGWAFFYLVHLQANLIQSNECFQYP